MAKKVLFVATVVKTHIMEFHIPYLKMFKEMGWETAVASHNDFENPADCVIPFCDNYYDIPFERNPINPGNLSAYVTLKKIIDGGNYDIIHCHTPVGAMLTRIAATNMRKRGTKVIYTAHGFHFYNGAPLLNWLLYYPVEKFLARKTDVLITINKEDYYRAQRKFKAGSIEYVPGVGINIQKFTRNTNSAELSEASCNIRQELQIPHNAIVLLSVGEINENKNHKAIINVLPKLPNCWYVICGRGPLIEEHTKLAKRLGVDNRLIFTGYRTDVADFYRMANVFVFPSLREGLPVALMEAMAAELPCVAAKNRGTNDLLSESKLLFDTKNEDELIRKLNIAINEDCSVEVSRNRDNLKAYDISNTLALVKEIYLLQ